MPRLRATVGLITLGLAVVPPAFPHAERPTRFPDPSEGRVPAYRTSGPSIVVCKEDSGDRISRVLEDSLRRRNLDLLERCAFRHIQDAVNAASSGTRILALPGDYREEPSRRAPYPDPSCASLTVSPAAGPSAVPGYAYQRRCPNGQNLIAIIGDSDGDGQCDQKCALQIEGTGAAPSDVVISGGAKLNVIRVDRADGIVLRNFTVQYSAFTNIYVLETNGFRLDRIVSRWSREYGFLSFTSDHGLYENLVTYGSGEAGIYPGSSPDGHCVRYGIEIRNVDSYGNVHGLSANAGNSLWVHDSRFHDNATGLFVGSLGPGHPGQPQDCAKLERNEIYSNNLDLYGRRRDAYCRRSVANTQFTRVCPTVPAPVGTGLFILGGNRNLVRNNLIYDNWRTGARLGWAPIQERPAGTVLGISALGLLARNAREVARMRTSHGNRFIANRMGVRSAGQEAANGVDFAWDGEGRRNCWSDNRGFRGTPVTNTRPRRLRDCPGRARSLPVGPETIAELVTCSGWNESNRDPRGCDWLALPSDPSPPAGNVSSRRPWRRIGLLASLMATVVLLSGLVVYRSKRLRKTSRP